MILDHDEMIRKTVSQLSQLCIIVSFRRGFHTYKELFSLQPIWDLKIYSFGSKPKGISKFILWVCFALLPTDVRSQNPPSWVAGVLTGTSFSPSLINIVCFDPLRIFIRFTVLEHVY